VALDAKNPAACNHLANLLLQCEKYKEAAHYFHQEITSGEEGEHSVNAHIGLMLAVKR
jgi:hypothetical protein